MSVAAVLAGSLSAAVARLEMALPTLSRHVRELEGALKVRLFERGAHGARLTGAGTRLYEHAVRGIESLDDAERAVASDEAQLRSTSRLSIPPSFEPWWRSSLRSSAAVR
jgi:DNA-binding transcriptional LysR family regulator